MNNNDIEEDIEIIEDTIRNYNITGEFKNPNYEDLDNISTAIENILADREKLLAKANKYDRLVERIEERIKSIGKCYSNLIEPYFDKDINMINTSCMSKREKEEFINKRNCLLVQKTTFEEILKLIEEE